jgi:hypothetical protein
MKVSIQRTVATEVDIASFHSVDQRVSIVAPAAVTPRRRTGRRLRTVRHPPQVSVDGLVEITLVRSSRNRLGGGARARPATAR